MKIEDVKIAFPRNLRRYEDLKMNSWIIFEDMKIWRSVLEMPSRRCFIFEDFFNRIFISSNLRRFTFIRPVVFCTVFCILLIVSLSLGKRTGYYPGSARCPKNYKASKWSDHRVWFTIPHSIAFPSMKSSDTHHPYPLASSNTPTSLSTSQPSLPSSVLSMIKQLTELNAQPYSSPNHSIKVTIVIVCNFECKIYPYLKLPLNLTPTRHAGRFSL